MLDFKNDWNIEKRGSKWILYGFEFEENNICSKFDQLKTRQIWW